MTHIDSLESRRLFAFGSLATAFGTNGLTGAANGGYDGSPVEVTVAADGKTTVGSAGGLARFNANGSPDAAFGTAGLTGFRRVSYLDHAVDASGRTYVLVNATSGTLVQRYTAAGGLDAGYGTSGSTLVESSKTFTGVAIDVQADGKVVVAGVYDAADSSSVTTRVYRLNAAGTARDASFAGDGVADFKLGVSDLLVPDVSDSVADVRVLSGGKIEVLGRSYSSADGDADTGVAALARLNGDGSLDAGFGTGGVARRATFDNTVIRLGVGTIRADGSAVIASTADADARTSFVGFNASGKTAFNTYARSGTAYQTVSDATALADGRTAFVNTGGQTFAVGTDGTVGFRVQPIANDGSGTNAVAGTADGDLIVAANKSPTVNLAKIDAGRIRDARPDNLPNAGAIDIAGDSFGGTHVAYFDTATKTLKYAYRNPQGYWGGIRTVDATAGAGAQISIDTAELKGRTNVSIGYYDASNADLRVASSRTNGRTFTLQTVTSKGSVGTSPNLLYTDSGGLAVSYYNRSTDSVYYGLNLGDGWTLERVDSGGVSHELQFDPTSRRPAVAYTKGKEIWYAFKGKGTTWEEARTRAVSTSDGAAFVNLAIPYNVSASGPKISYYDLGGADLKLASYDRYAAAGKRWSTSVVASRGVVGAYNDLFGYYYGDPTLYAYSRSGDSAFRYGFNAASGLATPEVAVTGGGKLLSLAADDTGDVLAVAYQDTATGLTFVR